MKRTRTPMMALIFGSVVERSEEHIMKMTLRALETMTSQKKALSSSPTKNNPYLVIKS